MEPNKLEQDFRNKLEQRTIEPSPMAWDRLDAMLSVTEEKRKPKRRTWMYAAASFLGFMLVGAILLKQEKENTGNSIDTTVVDTRLPAENKEDLKETSMPAIDEHVAVPKQSEAVAVQQNSTKKLSKAAQKQGVRKNINIKNDIAPVRQVNTAEEAVAIQEVHDTPANETEQLLAASMDNTDEKPSSVKVNAKSLLSSVEGELDDSFRQDVLQKIVKNYNTVKTSVANRNYEHR